MSYQERYKKIVEEPEPSYGDYLKPDKVKIGDMVQIESCILEGAREVNTQSGPVTIPERPVITGYFIQKGQNMLGQSVKVSLSKSNEKKLYQLWDKPLDEWKGKRMIVSNIQKKNIKGRDTVWIEWGGIP